MAQLLWDLPDERRYESGVNRAVFYPLSEPGIAWNGVVSVEESSVGAGLSSYHLDGVLYLTTVAGQNYQATVRAFSAPPEFGPYVGEREVIPGLILTKQPKPRFHFSYQTMIDSGPEYKIHMVYNALATPSSLSYETLGRDVRPTELEWVIDATPEPVPGFRPSAALVVNSSKVDPGVLSELEEILYGSEEESARFPTIAELLVMFGGS